MAPSGIRLEPAEELQCKNALTCLGNIQCTVFYGQLLSLETWIGKCPCWGLLLHSVAMEVAHGRTQSARSCGCWVLGVGAAAVLGHPEGLGVHYVCQVTTESLHVWRADACRAARSFCPVHCLLASSMCKRLCVATTDCCSREHHQPGFVAQQLQSGSKTRGTFDHRMRNFLLFVFVSCNIC